MLAGKPLPCRACYDQLQEHLLAVTQSDLSAMYAADLFSGSLPRESISPGPGERWVFVGHVDDLAPDRQGVVEDRFGHPQGVQGKRLIQDSRLTPSSEQLSLRAYPHPLPLPLHPGWMG